jgi:hypothetical protein
MDSDRRGTTQPVTGSSKVGRQIAVMVTRRCTMTCRHCSVESSPKVADRQPSQEELLAIVRDAAEAGVTSIQFTGGEPMMRPKLVLKLMREAQRLGVKSALSTNGFWGRTPASALRTLRALVKAGLCRLTVSHDRYHAEHQGPTPAVNIVRAAERLYFPVNINVTRLAGEEGLEQVVEPFVGLPAAQLRFYDVQPVGAAVRTVADDDWRGETAGFCNACDSPAISDDGRLMACNGPSYFAPPGHPLHLGSLRKKPLAELLAAHRDDPVLDTIRTFGPERLREELRRVPGFEDFPFRERYRGMCELCLHVTSRPEAVAALRARLSDSRFAAERLAMAQIIVDQRRAGSLSRQTVNAEAAARIFHRAIQTPNAAWTAESARVIGRADFDWQQQAEILVAAGLSRPLLALIADPDFSRFAPRFFQDRIRQAAVRDGIRELAQREVLRTLSTELDSLGGRGVLLKGAAILARGAPDLPKRAAGDIDIHVAPRLAHALRRRLLERGFKGDADDGRSAPHHLAAVSWRGVVVEIHTRIMPACWGLPEPEMLAAARPLPGDDFGALSTLSPEGMVLHCLAHTTTHLFAQGGKAGWDVAFLVRHAESGFDWQTVARWAAASRVPRAFWVPARVIAEELDLPLPADVLARAPADRRQRQLELIARRRLFGPAETAYAMNPFSRTAVCLMLHDGSWRRLGYLAWLFGPEAGEARRTARTRSVAQRLSSLPAHFRQALVQYCSFRAAAAAAER